LRYLINYYSPSPLTDSYRRSIVYLVLGFILGYNKYMQITIHCDGGARGNPGHSAVGAVLKIENRKSKIEKISKYIGIATNNQAEYQAIIEALKWVREQYQSNHLTSTSKVAGKVENLEIECFLDSELIVEQLNQRYKIKNEGLKPLFWQVRELVMALGGKVSFKYIPREKNKEADRLVNEVLDKAPK